MKIWRKFHFRLVNGWGEHFHFSFQIGDEIVTKLAAIEMELLFVDANSI